MGIFGRDPLLVDENRPATAAACSIGGGLILVAMGLFLSSYGGVTSSGLYSPLSMSAAEQGLAEVMIGIMICGAAVVMLLRPRWCFGCGVAIIGLAAVNVLFLGLAGLTSLFAGIGGVYAARWTPLRPMPREPAALPSRPLPSGRRTCSHCKAVLPPGAWSCENCGRLIERI